MPEYRQLDVFIVAKSAKAVNVRNASHDEAWIPRSQVHAGDDAKLNDVEKGAEFKGLRISKWILERKAEDSGSQSWLTLSGERERERPAIADDLAADCFNLVVREINDSSLAMQVKKSVRAILDEWAGGPIEEEEIPF